MSVAILTERDAYRVMLREYPDVLSVRQMCAILHISTKTGYQMIKRQEIQTLKIGRSYRVPKLSVLHHLTACRGQSPVVKSGSG